MCLQAMMLIICQGLPRSSVLPGNATLVLGKATQLSKNPQPDYEGRGRERDALSREELIPLCNFSTNYFLRLNVSEESSWHSS